jgi:hypothetical protein
MTTTPSAAERAQNAKDEHRQEWPLPIPSAIELAEPFVTGMLRLHDHFAGRAEHLDFLYECGLPEAVEIGDELHRVAGRGREHRRADGGQRRVRGLSPGAGVGS